MIVRQALSQLLHIKPCYVSISKGIFGKPFCRNSTYQFNISHSNECVAVALNDCSIGIDVEYINTEFDWREISRYVFTEIENVWLRNQKNEIYFMMWICKEAICKLVGCGLHTKFIKSFYLDTVGLGSNNVISINKTILGTIDVYKLEEKYVLSIVSEDNMNQFFWHENAILTLQ